MALQERAERQAMRQRGAANRAVDRVDFGLRFGTPQSAQSAPRQRQRRSRSATATPVPVPVPVPALTRTAAAAEDIDRPSAAKRRRISRPTEISGPTDANDNNADNDSARPASPAPAVHQNELDKHDEPDKENEAPDGVEAAAPEPAKKTAIKAKRRKRKSVIPAALRKRKRSSTASVSAVAVAESAVTEADDDSVDENANGEGGNDTTLIDTTTTTQRAPASPVSVSVTAAAPDQDGDASPDKARDVDSDSDEYNPDDYSPEPETPARARAQARTKTTARSSQAVPAVARTAKRSPRSSGSSFPITTQRMANAGFLPTVPEEGGEDDDDIDDNDDNDDHDDDDDNKDKFKSTANAIDILSQFCQETLASSSASSSTTASFARHLQTRLVEMSRTLNHRHDLETRLLRRARRDQAALQTRWLAIRAQRERLAARCERVRQWHRAGERERHAAWQLSELAHRLEHQLDRDEEAEEEEGSQGLEFLLRHAADQSSSMAVLHRLRGFNDRLADALVAGRGD